MADPDDGGLRFRLEDLTRSVERQVVVPALPVPPRRRAAPAAVAATVALLLTGVGVALGSPGPAPERDASPPAGAPGVTRDPATSTPPPTIGPLPPPSTTRRASPRPEVGSSVPVPPPVTGTPATPATAPVAWPVEDFSAGSAARRFATAGGRWAVADGAFRLDDPATVERGNGNLAIHSVPIGGEVVVQATLTAYEDESSWADASLVFGYRDQRNYHFLSVNRRNDADTSGIFRVQDGSVTELADVEVGIEPGQPVPVRVELVGGRIRASVDGTPVAEVAAAVSPGRVGFGTRNNAADFDDLSVTRR